ncbi:MAG: NlpC/P60 family protein [Thiobacillaceae bacterium]|jgi:cell wall-associated NlpC family hydrolase|nr:NlpC/P60 family protein [Thiobacillaceae bacterium]
MSHWITEYIGLPWVAGENDCWAFFRRVQRERFGLDLPAVDVDAMSVRACANALTGDPERSNWTSEAIPLEGDAVLMARGKHPIHIGMWAAGGVLHCVEHSGVVFQSVPSLKMAGWNHIHFYRHV